MFREHPESPIAPERRAAWAGFSWVSVRRGLRVRGVIDATAPRHTFEIPLAADGLLRCTRVGHARFTVGGRASALAMYWLEGSAAASGCRFRRVERHRHVRRRPLPLRHDQGRRPRHRRARKSCSTSTSRTTRRARTTTRWSCPLSPAENRLPFAVRAASGFRLRRPTGGASAERTAAPASRT